MSEEPASKRAKTEDVERINGVVVLEYADLEAGKDLTREIGAAYGTADDCLGVLLVRNVPGFTDARANLLPLAAKFAELPDDVKEKYVDAKSTYSYGWSHGKEIFAGKPDTAKGSFYANPQYDTPFADQPELASTFPESCGNNIWPSDDLSELEDAFKTMGKLIVKVGLMVSKQCDAYVASVASSYVPSQERIITESKSCKARLLHYFPTDGSSQDLDSWCGGHYDHGTLTGLCSAMYLDTDGKMVSNPDPTAGLYIRSRGGEDVRARIPADHLAFQIGESAQIMSGGRLRATYHCVRAAKNAQGISRNTYACFMQPDVNQVMDPPSSEDRDSVGVDGWAPGDTFAQFAQKRIDLYYEMDKKRAAGEKVE